MDDTKSDTETQNHIDFNKNLKLNATQYNLQDNIYCHNCYQILTNKCIDDIFKCVRCKLLTYCNVKCFRSNWKYHQYTCEIVTVDKQREIAKLPSKKCVEKFKQTFRNPTSKLVYYLKRILYILQNGDDHESDSSQHMSSSDIGMELHTSQRIHMFNKHSLVQYINILWGCYGIAEFVLNVPLIKHFRRKVYSEYGFPPNYSKLSDKYDELHDKLSYESNNDTYELSYFVVNFLCNTITTQGTQMRSASSNWDHYQSEFLSINDVPMFNVVCKRILEIWSDIHVIQDCGDSLAPILNVIETFVNVYGQSKHKMKKVIGCDFEYIILNTTIFDSCINEMLTAANKRAATCVLEYIVTNINYNMLWSNDKRIASYYVLLINYAIRASESYIEDDESNRINFNNLYNRQLELLRICMDKIMFGNDIKCNKQKQKHLMFVTKYILLYHGRLRKPESVDEWKISMPFYNSFLVLNNDNKFLDHYGFYYEITDLFMWHFAYWYFMRHGRNKINKYKINKRNRISIVEIISNFWETVKYDYYVNKTNKIQRQRNRIIRFIYSKCIPNKLYSDYKFWLDMKLIDRVTFNNNAKEKDKNRTYRKIEKICGNPICPKYQSKKYKIISKFRKCAKCKSVYYCSRKCQKIHWKYSHHC
eukprot:148043_1